MNNLNECTCITVNRLRQHHGVVCTTCNPNRIEHLIVPQAITAYRVWRYDHQNAFHKSTSRKGWSDFNDVLPPGFGNEHDHMQPWSGPAFCMHHNHKAPNPYCSCGYYSINKFGKTNSRPFGHDSSAQIVSCFDRLKRDMERYEPQTQKLLAELLFYSPVAKTIEILDFSLLSEVELTGTIVECEMGYRSEFVTPQKMYLLLDIDKLYQVTSYLGKNLAKDEAEIFHVTYQWVIYIDNYLTNIMKLFGLDFELRLKYNPQFHGEYEMLNGNQSKGPDYLPLRNHPLVYTKIRFISEYMEESEKFQFHKYPSLSTILEELKNDTSNIAYLDRARNSLAARHRRSRWIGTPVTLSNNMRRDHIASFFENYADYLLSFAHFNCMLSEKANDKINLLSYPNLTKQFGFQYHTYLENKYEAKEVLDQYTISKEHPSLWFKNVYPYFEQYLESRGLNTIPIHTKLDLDEL